MDVLVLGGTAFLGRHLVEVGLERGHRVTLFTRARTNPGLYPEAEHLRGDRETDLSALAGRSFDVVLDTSGYLPRVVERSAQLLGGRVGRYVFVSTLSVYAESDSLDELSPTRGVVDPEDEDITASYGPLKARCEQVVQAAFPDRSLLIRPGLLVGRYDYTGRFGYWPRRVARGGEVLAPGPSDRRVWFLDALDLAVWIMELAERLIVGVFNAAGPEAPLSMGELLTVCRAVTGADPSFTWVDDAFLVDRGIEPYNELPLWIPDLSGGYPFLDLTKAIAAGLTFRPLADTIADVLEGDSGFDAETVRSFGWARTAAGLTFERERGLLADWHSLHG